MATKKQPALLSKAQLNERFRAAEERLNRMTMQLLAIQNERGDVLQLQRKFVEHGHQIRALEEAICPRVAARLTALERVTEVLRRQQQPTRVEPLHWPTSCRSEVTGSIVVPVEWYKRARALMERFDK